MCIYIYMCVYTQWLQCMILFATFTNVANICNIGLRSVWEQTFIYDSRPGLIYGFGLPAPGHHMGFVPYAWSLFLIFFRHWTYLLFLPKEGRLILALMCNLFILFQHVSSDAASQPAMQLERQCFRRFVLRCSMLSSWYWFKTHHTRCKYAPPTASGARSLSMPGSNHLKSLNFRKAQQPQSSLKLHCEHAHIGHWKQSRWV